MGATRVDMLNGAPVSNAPRVSKMSEYRDRFGIEVLMTDWRENRPNFSP
jgi:hypothetical protein